MSDYTLDDWYRALDQLGKRPKWQKNRREIRARLSRASGHE